MANTASLTARNSWVDNLRSFITVLVVAHHSSLAYTTFAYFNKAAYIASTHPIVDMGRSRALDIFEDFNDIFFMSLMFLISGLFVMASLRHKPVQLFIRDRFYRLFIPFLVGVTLLMLLAYYPAYYLAHGEHNVKAYIIDFFSVEAWPVGPPWFIWVLFFFNVISGICYPLVKHRMIQCGNWLAAQQRYPWRVFVSWYIFSWMLYLPALHFVSPGAWTGIGPFDFQISRALLYFGYFVLGIIIGAPGLNSGILGDDSALVKRWPVWVAACFCTYALLKCSEAPLTGMIARKEIGEWPANLIYRSAWILSCTLSSIAFLTTFRSLFRHSNRWWKSLSVNAYGIYLVHYIFVIWCQYALLDFPLPPVLKFFITFIVAVLLSWWLTDLLRTNASIRKYL